MFFNDRRRFAGPLLLVLLWFFSPCVLAQVDQQPAASWKFPVLGTEHGLSSNFCYAIAQDRKGFLWIATHDGLNRYDGYGFRVYRHNPADPHSLPGNTVTAVQADHLNRVWVIADGMLAVFDPEKDRFATMRYPGLATGIRQIFVTADQRLLVAGKTAALIDLFTLKPIALGEQSLLPEDEQPCAGKVHYGVSNDGQLIAVRTCGRNLHWFSFNPSGKRIQLVRSFTIAQPQALITPVTSTTLDRHGRLRLVFSGYRPLVLDRRDSIIQLTPSPWTANHLFEDPEGMMYYSTEAGLFMRQKTDPLERGRASTLIPSEVIRYGFRDLSGLLWFAGSKGIFRVESMQRHVRHYSEQGDVDRLLDDFVMGLRKMPNGRICVDYFGQQQYTMIDPDKGIATHIPLRDRKDEDWLVRAFLSSREKLPRKPLIDLLSRKLQSLQIPPNLVPGLMLDDTSNAWFVVNNSLRHTGSGQSISLPEIPMDVKSDGDAMWLAFPGQGLWRFDPISRQLSQVLAGKMATGDITSILPGDSGVLWVGTKGAGIYRVVPRTGAYMQYTTDQGLAHNSVYSMTIDHRGRLWIGTANGLSCLHPSRSTFHNFFKWHGFANAEYNRHSAITLEDGRVAVGGMSGIDLFHPDSLSYDRRETVLQLTDVKVHNISRGVHPVYRLNHDLKMVSVHFAVMDFRQPESNQFKYQLSDADTGWIMLGNRNSITFDYLKPGEHTIRIRGANSDGVWSTHDLTLRLDVQPAWYQRWWFYLLVSALVAGLGYFWFSYRLRQKLHVYRVRQRIHRDLHDDVGATLSSVKAYAEILTQYPDNPVIPALIAENASEMIERLEVISWAADPRHDHMASLRNRMIKYATPICHMKGIECVFRVEGISEELEVPGEIRQQLFLIFKEAIHNMVKYADAHRCEVIITIVGNIFEMRVRDDGQGADGIIRGTGQGWLNMEERARELGGTLQIRTAPGQGTEVIFQLRFPFSIPDTWGRNEI